MKKIEPHSRQKRHGIYRDLPKQVETPYGLRWVVDAGWIRGRHVRRRFKDPQEAIDFQAHVKQQLAQFGEAWDIMRKEDRAQILSTVHEIQNCGVTLNEVWRYYNEHHSGVGISLEEALNKWLDTLADRGRSSVYITRQRDFTRVALSQIDGATPLHDITPEMMDKCSSNRDRFDRWRIFLHFAVKNRWIKSNPCTAIESPKPYKGNPMIISNDQVRNILSVTMGSYHWLSAYFILGFFAGLRPSELRRLKWRDVSIADNRVHIHDGKTGRRVFHFIGNTAGVLNLYKDLPIWQPRHESAVKRIKRLWGTEKWKSDCMRHTAATHLVNHYESLDKAAIELGNSPQILRKHYYGLASKKVSEDFWRIL